MNLFRIVISVFLSVFLLACVFTNKTLTTEYSAAADVNQDIYRMPSPLVIMTYQLKSVNAFKNADFFSLYPNPTTTLGEDLVSLEQTEIKPQQKLVFTEKILPPTKFIAVIAAYRDIDNAIWRVVIPVAKIKHRKLKILFQNDKLVVY
jgi:type VI secretion system protein VasD